jgi:hypothetical protein
MIYNNLHFDIRKNIKKISLIIVFFFTLISTDDRKNSRDLNISKAA